MTAQQLGIAIVAVCALIGCAAGPAITPRPRYRKFHVMEHVISGAVGAHAGAVVGVLLICFATILYDIGLWAYTVIQK